MWVYVGVFELAQWLLFLGLLAATFLALMIIGHNDKMDNAMVKNIFLGVETVFMYTLQLGNHPLGERMSKRFLFLTASLLTFLIFAYYTTNVTALMTFTRATIQLCREIVVTDTRFFTITIDANYKHSLRFEVSSSVGLGSVKSKPTQI